MGFQVLKKVSAWFKVLAIFLVLGPPLTLGALMSLAAWEHNPQGEFFNPMTGEVNVVSLGSIFLSWFVLGTLVSFALVLIAGAVANGIRHILRTIRQ